MRREKGGEGGMGSEQGKRWAEWEEGGQME